jgi:polysaccharide export outer membrane protein
VPAIHSEDIYTPLIEAAVEAEEPYLLDTGDRVRVFVYGQPNLSRVYAIDGNGFIAMPLIGSVMARGLTTYDLSSQIARLLRTQYLRDPVVTAEITAYRPFYILGEVRNAGQYAYVPGMTVQSAVATAGGFGPRAYQKTVKLGRLVDGAHREIDVPPTYRVRPGDTIVVEERFF